MGCPFCVLSRRTAAHVEQSRLSECRTEKSARYASSTAHLRGPQLASRAPWRISATVMKETINSAPRARGGYGNAVAAIEQLVIKVTVTEIPCPDESGHDRLKAYATARATLCSVGGLQNYSTPAQLGTVSDASCRVRRWAPISRSMVLNRRVVRMGLAM